MATLNPTLDGGIGYEQPTQAPSGGGSMASAVLDLGSTFFPSGKQPEAPKPTQTELNRAALQPFAQRMEDLRNSDLSDTEFNRQARLLTRKQYQATPDLGSDIANISDAYGVTEPTLPMSPDESITKARNEWIQTPEGQEAAFRSMTTDEEGFLDEEATAGKLNQYYAESQAEKAQVARTSRELELVQNDLGTWKAKSELAMRDFVPNWTKRSQGAVNNMLELARSGAANVDSPEEQLNFIREARRTLGDNFRASAQAAGIHPDVYKQQIEDALGPVNNLLETMENNLGDIGAVNTALQNAAEKNQTEFLIENLGVLGSNPEFQKQVFANLGGLFYDEETFGNAIKMSKDHAEAGRTTAISILPNLPAEQDAVEAGKTGETIGDVEYQDAIRREQEQDSGTIPRNITTATQSLEGADVTTPTGQEIGLRALGDIINNSEASGDPLGSDLLNGVFSPKNVRNLSTAVNGGTQASQDMRSSLQAFSANEIMKNMGIIEGVISGMSEGTQVIEQNGRMVLQDAQGNTVRAPMNAARSGEQDLFDALSNINKINSANKRIFGKQPMTFEEMLTPNVTEEQAVSEMDAYLSQSNAPAGGLTDLIDREEGGGDYDTLFGFSNRPGRSFEDIQVSRMTIGELKDFANVQGEYGQWVKGQLREAGQRARVATPMGRYQFVGTTLEDTADAMGLPDDTVFTPEVQDAMFAFKARQRLAGKTSAQAKRNALRNEWEGFKNVSDAELDAAIQRFENGDPGTRGTVLTRPSGPAGRPINADIPSRRPMEAQEQFVPETGGRSIQPSESDFSAVSVPQAPAPTEDNTQATQEPQRASETPSASQSNTRSETEKLSTQSQKLLQILQRDPSTVPTFSSEEEVQDAMDRGEVKENEVVIINGEVKVL